MTTRTALNHGVPGASTAWRKSTRSTGNGSTNCVEARATGGVFEVRDSKLSDESPIFGLSASDFAALLQHGREV